MPIAVTAFSGEELERQGAIDITDLADTTPNVTLEASRGTNSTLTAFIRGVGQQDPVAGFEAGVGLYLDDVYLNRPQAAVLDIYDVERIEVLRGPQGTLYGRNTIGGAIKYVTRRLADHATLRARANLGTYEQADLIVSASTPVADRRSRRRLGRAAVARRLRRQSHQRPGQLQQGRLGRPRHGRDRPSRMSSSASPAIYTKDNTNPRSGHRADRQPRQRRRRSWRRLRHPRRPQRPRAGRALLWRRLYAEFSRPITDAPEHHRLSPGQLRHADRLRRLARRRRRRAGIYRNSQFSNELQCSTNGGFNGVIGGYYLDANANTIFDVRLPNGLTALTFGDVDTETWALFGDFTYDFTDRFSVSLGGRYTRDKRQATILRQNFLGGGSPALGGAGVQFGADLQLHRHGGLQRIHAARLDQLQAGAEQHDLSRAIAGLQRRRLRSARPFDRGARPQPTAFAPSRRSTIPLLRSGDGDSYEIGYTAQLLDRRLISPRRLLRRL